MACTLAESPSDPFHRKLQQLRCLRCRFDCYRVERTSSRAGVAPAEVQRLSRRTFSPIIRALHPRWSNIATEVLRESSLAWRLQDSTLARDVPHERLRPESRRSQFHARYLRCTESVR